MTDLGIFARTSSQHNALSEHRTLRIMTLFLLYVAQGLPLGLIDFALPAWLAQNGASAAAIGGVLAMMILPWTFKLPYGLLMDRYAFLAMGRRRPWIIIAQLGLVAALVTLAIANPQVTDIGILATLAFTLGLCSAVQDVAVDGLAVDILPPHEIEQTNGLMFGGQAIGIAAGTALGGYLLAFQGLPAAALAIAAILAVILVLVLCIRERAGERLLPWTIGTASQRNLDIHIAAFVPIIRNLFVAMFTRQTLMLMPAFIAGSACFGIFLGLGPIFSAEILGWEKATYSGWSSQASLFAGLVGGLVFGTVAGRWGARRMFIVGALGFVVFGAAMGELAAEWRNPAIFIAAIFVVASLRMLNLVAAGSLGMRLCVSSVAATQFAVFMAIANLGKAGGTASLGWLDGLGGIPAMFTAMAVCGLVATAFALAAKVGR